MASGIYEIRNKVNGNRYIGSAVDIERRLSHHNACLNTQHHGNVPLQRAWKKYGKDNFLFHELLFCDKEDLLFFEQRVLDNYENLYNICRVAGNTLGYKHTSETKEKCRIAQKRQVETIGHPRLGTKHSAKTIEKMRKIPKTQKQRDAVAESNRNRVESEETQKKRTASIRAFYADPERSKEARRKIRASNRRKARR